MASIIKSDNGVSSGITGIVQSADSSGQLVLQTTTSSGTATTAVTIDNTQVATFANTLKAPNLQGPAFSAFSGALQTVSTTVWTKVLNNTKRFDTNSNYDNSTNYRFTPTVAGYYQINASAYVYPSVTGITQVALYKNGASYVAVGAPNANQGPPIQVCTLMYFNGSTDYVEAYVFQNSGGSLSSAGADFSGSMVRSA